MKKGWVTKKLGDLTTKIGSGATPLGGEEAYKTEGISLIRSLNVYDDGFREAKLARIDNKQADDLSNVVVEPHDVLLNITGASVARCCLAPADFLPARVNQHVSIIRPIKGKLDSAFLHYLLISKTYKDRLLHTGEEGGSTRQAITKAQLQEFVVEYPEMLPAQQRIVGLLDEAFEGIASAKANAEINLENARALFGSLLNDAIQGKLLPQNPEDGSVTELISRIERARNRAISQGSAKPEKTEAVEAHNERHFKLPQGWRWTQLESLTISISDGVHKKPHYVPKGIPFVTVKNLTEGPGISFDNLNYITRHDHAEFIKRTHPEKGDILITKDGTIGVVRLIETDIEFSIFVSVALIKPVLRELGTYLVYALRASCVQSQIVPQGAALKHLYLVDLRRLSIPLPPMSEQERIVSRLDLLESETQRLQSVYQQKLIALNALKKSLLNKAFSGEL